MSSSLWRVYDPFKDKWVLFEELFGLSIPQQNLANVTAKPFANSAKASNASTTDDSKT